MNEEIFYQLHSLAHQSVAFDRTIVFLAETFPYVVIILGGLFLLFHHEVFKADNPLQVLKQKYKEIILVFFSGALAWTLAHILKFLLHIPRPTGGLEDMVYLFEKTGYGFPSGHASFYMALAFSIFLVHKKAGYIFMALALLISMARIVAGVHYPIDILGGFVLGILVASVVDKLYAGFAKSGRNL